MHSFNAQIVVSLVAEFVQKSAGLSKKQQLTGLFCERDHSLVPQTPFEWKAELGSAFKKNTAYNAQLGNVTYYWGNFPSMAPMHSGIK
jgi:hypothetical protein